MRSGNFRDCPRLLCVKGFVVVLNTNEPGQYCLASLVNWLRRSVEDISASLHSCSRIQWSQIPLTEYYCILLSVGLVVNIVQDGVLLVSALLQS